MKQRRFFARLIGIGFAILLSTINYSDSMVQLRAMPDTLYLTENDNRFSSLLDGQGSHAATVDVQSAERLSDVADGIYTFRLFGVIPLRTVEVIQTDGCHLIPGGSVVGITLHTRGVLVVGLGSVKTAMGSQSPVALAGLQAGDCILTCNGTELENTAHLASMCSDSDQPVLLSVERDGNRFDVTVHPAKDRDSGEYRLGIWARDSTAGVGTLSFIDASNGWFAALGHAVSDVDTQSVLQVRDGKVTRAEVVDVVRGAAGEPGELLGIFSAKDTALGNIVRNTDYGIFGTVDPSLAEQGESVPLARAYEAHVGPATILSTIEGDEAEAFSCRIVRVSEQKSPSTKGMVVQVDDPDLIGKTGGIVQGMSGSPVLQDGKLVGVVTHVFVNDPTKGYCIYAEWMYRQVLNFTA